MTPEDKKRVIAKLEERYSQKYGRKFQISTQAAVPDTFWAYGLELSRCIGCRRCVYACVKENNQSRHDPQLQWIRVLRLKRGNLINLENSEHYYHPDLVPEKGFIYLPVQCQQCQEPPCVKVCPVHAPGKNRMVSSWSTTTGASVAGTALQPAPIREGLQLGGAKHSKRGDQSLCSLSWKPTPDEVRRGKMHLLYPTSEKWKIPCVCGSLSYRNEEIWQSSRSKQRNALYHRPKAGVPAQGRFRHRTEVLLLL